MKLQYSTNLGLQRFGRREAFGVKHGLFVSEQMAGVLLARHWQTELLNLTVSLKPL